MEFWKLLLDELLNENHAILMYVVHSEGSSPGRAGFKMFVSNSGNMFGSVGGGFMEHKWVDLCKREWLHHKIKPFVKKQVHRLEVKENKSGLICSGEQTIAFYSIDKEDIPFFNSLIEAIETGTYGSLELTEEKISFHNLQKSNTKYTLNHLTNDKWSFTEDIRHFTNLYIVGGGHVSLALSKLANLLGFNVTVFDNRLELNTMERNEFGQTTFVADYSKMGTFIPEGDNSYVVLMSFGYHTDKTILTAVLPYPYKYLGMMGSKEKVKKLFKELREEGIADQKLASVYAPIGLFIHSQTPEEIAVSILAQMIKVKNSST